MACIDIAEAERTAEEIREEIRVSHPSGKTGELVVKKLDLTSLESIRSCAEDIKRTERQIHILINNAGILPGTRRLTEDGFEHAYVTNYLGHFYLTCLLLPKVLASTPSRIVNVASKVYECKYFVNTAILVK
ncbi:unnamed protein product [Bemisia tabaci]|uniref:Short-chain dehydrogenase n=1 Tax=Bemisia tabaci TaxID=7038 RepID=A0A9P0AQ87_BEMTA|nr:unnamed protein product [Bemisia tabaci]